ncbi:MAG: tetratricopeptide repeat protein [Bacteroidales bacterium]|nr:tetratricopeptide repeat protein [Bacteroidales bacterium]
MKKTVTKHAVKAPKNTTHSKVNFKYAISPIAAAITLGVVTFIIFLPALGNDFVNWDDPAYVLNNMRIRNFDLGVLIEMFNPFPKNYLVGNYHPLTELSLAVDHIFYGLKPKGFLFTNIFIHSINTSLVFFLIFRMTNGRVIAGILTALFFGINPMHVESVVWVSERKDVLHVFFYLRAMLTYLRYLKSGCKEGKLVGYTLLLFICSLLSKAQAVTLPIVLLLMDYFYNRKDLKKLSLEKAPFFILSLLFGLLAIKAQSSTPAITLVDIPWIYRPFTGSYALFTYLWMMVAPVGLSALHPYPFEIGETPPAYIFASIFVMIALFAAIFISLKKGRKEIAFGLTFFFFTILPVLQFLTVGEAIFAERYTYLPYIGLFFIIGYYVDTTFTLSSLRKYRKFVFIVVIISAIFFARLSWNRIHYWKNSAILWSDVLDKYPNSRLACLNLSHFYLEVKEYDKSIEYAEIGMGLYPDYYKFYVNKAVNLMRQNQNRAAIVILEEARRRDPEHYEISFNLGVCYDRIKEYDKSIEYYTKTLEYEPDFTQAFQKRGIIYSNYKNDHKKAIADFKKVIENTPTDPEGLMNLAVSFYKTQQYEKALEYAHRSVNVQPGNGKSYYVRSVIYQALGQNTDAQADMKHATRLGYNSE